MPPGILPSDRSQLFTDWSEPITLRTITQTYDPDTLQLTESHTDIALDAIIGLHPQSPTPTTAAQHHSALLTVTVKSEDIPASISGPLTRLLYNALEYQVTTITENPTSQLTTLQAHRL
jgi:hypothetical protein